MKNVLIFLDRNSDLNLQPHIRQKLADGISNGTFPSVSTYVNDTPLYANVVIRDIERVETVGLLASMAPGALPSIRQDKLAR